MILMTNESRSGKEAEKTEKPPSVKKFSIPIGPSIEDIRRAIRILSDSGGQARIGEIGTSFGTKPSDKTHLGWALNAAIAFGLIEPHKKKTPYVLSNDGKKFLGSTEAQQRAMLLPKFLGFEGYKKTLVAMKNSQDKSLKKQAITDMWLQVRAHKLGTRQYYTTTFASVGTWCGAITDTGQTCSLTPEGETVLEQILKGKEAKVPTKLPSVPTTPTAPLTTAVTPALPAIYCPHCGKSETGIENEDLLNTLSSNGSHILIVKTTYFCRGCSRSFSTIGQRLVEAGD